VKTSLRLWEHLVQERILPDPLAPAGFLLEKDFASLRVVSRADGREVLKFRKADELLVWARRFVRERLGEEFDDVKFEQVRREMAHSVLGERLALQQRPGFTQQHKLWDGKVLKNGRDLLFFERLASFDGHPHHPTSKCKIPLTEFEILSYAPEFGNAVGIIIAAVHRSLVVANGLPSSSTELFREEFPGAFQEWITELKKEGIENSDEFEPIPIHPANLATVKDRFRCFFDQRAILLLECHVCIETTATSSFRTMVSEVPGAPHLKLPVNVQATSLIRYVSPVEAHDSPELSIMFRDLVKRFGNEKLHVLSEDLGVHFDYKNNTGFTYDDGRYLSFLTRENPEKELVLTRFVCLPVSVLFTNLPCCSDGSKSSPLMLEMLRRDARIQSDEDLQRFFERYTEIVVDAVLGLWVRCGIVVEAHQQNTLLVLERSTCEVVKILYRDLCGGICAHRTILDLIGWGNITERLHERQDYILGSDTDPETDAEDFEYMLGALEHVLLRNHLIPLSERLELDPKHFLRFLRNEIDKCCDSYSNVNLESVDQMEILRLHAERTRNYILKSEHLQYKCLLIMRFKGSKEEEYAPVANPLLLN